MGSSFGTLLRLTTFGESHGIYWRCFGWDSTSNTNILKKYNRNLIEEDTGSPKLVHREKTRFIGSGLLQQDQTQPSLSLGTPVGFYIRDKDARVKSMQKSKIYIAQVILIIRTMQSMGLGIGVVVEDLLLVNSLPRL